MVNTNPVLVGAVAKGFLKLGVDSVVVGEGPGHQRDTYLVLFESGLGAQLRSRKISFVDLNRDELRKVPMRAPTPVWDISGCLGLYSPLTS